jgi:hypothetical protein
MKETDKEAALVIAATSAVILVAVEASDDGARRDAIIAACDYVADSRYWIESYISNWRVRAPEEAFRKSYFDFKRAPWDPYIKNAGTCGVTLKE